MNDQNKLKLEKALEKIEADYAICLKELNESRQQARIKAYKKWPIPSLAPTPKAGVIFLP